MKRQELGQVAYEAYIQEIKRVRPSNLMHQVKWSDLPPENKKMWECAEKASGRRMSQYMGHDGDVDEQELGYNPYNDD